MTLEHSYVQGAVAVGVRSLGVPRADTISLLVREYR